MQKARRRPVGLRPLVDERFQVLFHSPVRGASHLSLTVLVRYRSSGNIQPCGMVPADSDRIPRVPPYSGSALASHPLPVREYHPLRPDFPDGSSSCVILCARPYNPGDAVTPPVWALPLSIATTQGIDFLSFPGGTEMFQFPPFAPSIDGDRPSA